MSTSEAQNGGALSLPADDLDDLIYFARIGDLQELQSMVTSLATSHSSSPERVISGAIDLDVSDPKSSSGCSLLHWAAANNHIDVLKYLLSTIGGDNANAKPSDPSSKTLIPQEGALVNHRNTSGNTALHWAALNGNLECVKLLVQAGADSSIRNAAGKDSVFEAERGELNRNGSEQQEAPEEPSKDQQPKKEMGVVDWLLENCEGLDKSLGRIDGETSENVPNGESGMDVDG